MADGHDQHPGIRRQDTASVQRVPTWRPPRTRPRGKDIPGAMNAFLAKHPETAAALQVIGKHPFSSGFGDSPYYALNAFRFVNAQGESTPVRWFVTPDQTFRGKQRRCNRQELFVRWTDRAASCQAAALASDSHHRPARRFDGGRDAVWPPDRKQIDAGTLTINTDRERRNQSDARYQFRSAGAAGWDIAIGRPAAERALGGVFTVLHTARSASTKSTERNFNGGG